MGKIFIEKIELKNFGGVARGEYEFAPLHNEVASKKGSGKSSLYYAYLWVLGFNVKNWEPMLEGNYRIPNLETEVNLYMQINLLHFKFTRTCGLVYDTNKFSGEKQYKGNNSKYYIDNQEFSATTYKKRIEELFALDYKTIEILSVCDKFNTMDNLARRDFLFKLFGIDKKMDEINNSEKYASLKKFFDKGLNENEIGEILHKEEVDIKKNLSTNTVLIKNCQEQLASKTMQDIHKSLDGNICPVCNRLVKGTKKVERMKNNFKIITNLFESPEEKIKKLVAKNQELAAEDGERLKRVDLLRDYTKEKVEMVNIEINKNFDKIRYNFFEPLTSNSKLGYKEVCQCIYENVNYDSMSSGQKVEANKLIIEILQKKLGVSLPMFIDDSVLSGEIGNSKEMQQIYLFTNNKKNLDFVLVKQVFRSK